MDNLFCTDCGQKLENDEKKCHICDSENKTKMLFINDSAKIHESMRGKVKEEGKKHPIKEFKLGDDFNYDRKKYVDRKMIIDRKDNKYIEVITDKETGDIIHECNESLKEHYDHGNARKS